MPTNKYVMTISRMTVDKLGVKLYDRVSAVIAELVANSYDADAEIVTIEAPMGVYLATAKQGGIVDAGHRIIVSDNGCGISPDDMNLFYLKVGGERRKDPKRGDRSAKFKRRVMGRKGVGKLAPFGICGTIEVISAGGPKVNGKDEAGKPAKGYLTAHFTMKRDSILSDEDEDYLPEVGKLDGTVRPKTGTTLVLSDFARRQVPDMTSFARQLSQRFGLSTANWKIGLIDSLKTSGKPGRKVDIGDFDIDTMENTKILFSSSGPDSTESVSLAVKSKFQANDEKGKKVAGVEAGFVHEDGRFYPITGWVAYSKESYRDDLMAGIRIYCRGKIAAQTSVFNRKSGFTGEYNIRSYLVGELHADWLDESEDLIQTDRRDILWSDDLGEAFEAWGQNVVELLGTRSREPMKKKIWEQFLEKGKVIKRIEHAFPGDAWKPVRETTLRVAKIMGERLRQGEVQDTEYVDSLVELSIMLGPHLLLDDTLRNAAEEGASPLDVVANILRTARVAELSSYGLIAEKRIRVIEKIMSLKDEPATLEDALQDSIEEAPWLVNPQWSPITSNQSLETLRTEFEKFYKRETGVKISLASFEKSAKRPDFVLSSQDYGLQIIEIKRPHHTLTNKEWERIQTYIDVMDKFLNLPGHKDFKELFKGFTVTLVCDKIGLSGSQQRAFASFKTDRIVEHITWTSFLRRTQHMHKEFLAEAARQRSIAVKT